MALTKQWDATWNEKFVKVVSYTGTGAGVINETLDLGVPFQLVELRIMSDGAVSTSEEFTLKLDSGAGATFDQEYYGVDLSSSGYPVQRLFDARRWFGPSDKIDIDFPNTETNTITFELIVRVGHNHNV